MELFTGIFEHANFDGRSFFRGTGNARYRWDNWWGDYNDLFSSMRLWAIGGARGTAYAFDNFQLRGRFAALNVGGAFTTAWWSYFGSDFNDVTSSTLIVRRESADREVVLPLRARIGAGVGAALRTQGGGDMPVVLDGNPRVHATFFPSWGRQGTYVSIEQDLNLDLAVSGGPFSFGGDFHYDITVTYHVQFVTDHGRIRGQAVRSEVGVTGVFSSYVADLVAPRLHGVKSLVTSAIESQLRLLQREYVADVYLLPGRVPDMDQAGFKGNDHDDVCLVLVRG